MKKLIVYFVIFIFLICLIGCGKQSQNASPKTTAIATTELITSEEITELATEASTEEPTTEYQIETKEYECPIEYNEEMLFELRNYIGINYGGNIDACFYNTGYDNPILRQILIDYVENKTGVRDETITIDNFKYFQFGGGASNSYSLEVVGKSIQDQMEKIVYAQDLYVTRAVLIENDLRYMIDEIPYSYFEDRFPDIMNDFYTQEYRDNLFEQYYEICDKYQITTDKYARMDKMNDNEKEIVEFCSLMLYNCARTPYMYNFNIPQVRDVNTNKIQLDPVKSQIDSMNKGASKIPGFIDNVMEVETRENYYECYGEYPEDVIN